MENPSAQRVNTSQRSKVPLKPATAQSALKIQKLLGPEFQVMEFDASTRTAIDAANAIGCRVEHIAKSLIFRNAKTEEPVLVIASGSNRVDEKAVAAIIGSKVKRADADFVRRNTGYAIGGVPPLGHEVTPITLIDSDIFSFEFIWAAAGTPNSIFKITPTELEKLTQGKRANIAKA